MIESARKISINRERERLAIWKVLRTRKIGMRIDQIQIPLEKQQGMKMNREKILKVCREMSKDPLDGRVHKSALKTDRWVAVSDFHCDPDQQKLL